MNKIPDDTIFGPNDSGEGINYRYVRSIQDETELIRLLKLRLEGFFVRQVQPLQDAGSAFPLTVMTCIGIETLGEIFVPEKDGDSSYQFVETVSKMHQVFGRKPESAFLERFAEIWSEKDSSNINSYGKLLYRFFRNTMIHGYQGKSAFLSYEDTDKIEIKSESGFMVINPDWLWNTYKAFFEKRFSEVLKAPNDHPKRLHCLKYIRGFLLE
ncbi:MAG: hypothetical protein L6Q97_09055 [Thermoanaerobaculia bacterium]|nr:hypothetical protein [Thermoanaerobaculia bacterium]